MTVFKRHYRHFISPFEQRESKEQGSFTKLDVGCELEVIQKGYALEFIQNHLINWGVRCTPLPVNSEAREVFCRQSQILLKKNLIVLMHVNQVQHPFPGHIENMGIPSNYL